MKLFQYWDTPEPPDEVAGWIAGFRDLNPEFKHQLFDERSAAEFIGSHFGPRKLEAFRALAVPAVQSDYFRLCALRRYGGVYVDADFESARPLIRMLKPVRHGLVLMWRNEMVNGLIMVRQPGDPFIAACLKLATDNILTRRFQDVRRTAGIGLMNALWALVDEAFPEGQETDVREELTRKWDAPEVLEAARGIIRPTPELAASIRALVRVHVLDAARWIATPRPAYKATDRHWLNWKGSIYRG